MFEDFNEVVCLGKGGSYSEIAKDKLVIMVTHNEAIKNMADHVIKLRDGRVRHNEKNTNKISAVELEW